MSEPASSRISLCMIVRDEEQLLPGCLESVRGVVDEIVVVDTGSSDATPEIVRAHGGAAAAARVAGGFLRGAQRLARRGDGRLDSLDGRRRAPAARGARAAPAADRAERRRGRVPRPHPKRDAHRRAGDARAPAVPQPQGNPVLRADPRADLALVRANPRPRGPSADFTIDHLGYNFSADKLRSKYERNLRLLAAAKRQNPRDAYVRFCLGQTLMLLGDRGGGGERNPRGARRGAGRTDLDAAARRHPRGGVQQPGAVRAGARRARGGAPAVRRVAGHLPEQVTAHLMAYRAHQALGRSEPALAGADRGGPAARSARRRPPGDRSDGGPRGAVARDGPKPVAARPAGAGAGELPARPGRPQGPVRKDAGARSRSAPSPRTRWTRRSAWRTKPAALAPEDDGLADLACFILLKLGRFDEAAERMRGCWSGARPTRSSGGVSSASWPRRAARKRRWPRPKLRRIPEFPRCGMTPGRAGEKNWNFLKLRTRASIIAVNGKSTRE